MNQHSILVRAANPTFDEGLVFARYLDEAAGFFRLMLGRNVMDIIATAYTQPDHDLSYQNVIVAERDNVIISPFFMGGGMVDENVLVKVRSSQKST